MAKILHLNLTMPEDQLISYGEMFKIELMVAHIGKDKPLHQSHKYISGSDRITIHNAATTVMRRFEDDDTIYLQEIEKL